MKSVLAILFLIMTAGMAAAEPSIPSLALKEAVALALEQNGLVKAAGYGSKAARYGVAIANARYYPGIFFEETFSASNAPTQTFMMKLDEGRFTQNDFQISNLNHPGTHHDFRTALSIRQPLFTPANGPLREIALREAEQEDHGLDRVRQEIAFQVFRTYLDVQKAAAQQIAAGQAMAEARENLRLATVRGTAGVGLKSDELRARTHLAAIESQLITAENNLTLAEMRLALVTGTNTSPRVAAIEPLGTFASLGTYDELIGTALEQRSDLRQARTVLAKSDAAVKLARSAYLPSLDAVASYQMNAENTPFGSNNDAWSAGISLKWQLFDGFRRCNDRDRAAAGRSAAAERVGHAEREIAYQVQESLLLQTEMEKRREVARHAVRDAEETVRLLSRRFENSLATMAELLDAQSALNQARAGLVESESDLVLAGGRIRYASGVFVKEIMK